MTGDVLDEQRMRAACDEIIRVRPGRHSDQRCRRKCESGEERQPSDLRRPRRCVRRGAAPQSSRDAHSVARLRRSDGAARLGSIVNVSSMAATQALSGVLGYSVAKAGIDNLTKWLAVEMARRHSAGIRVNAIAPGFFVSEQNRNVLIKPDGGFTDRAQTIVGRTPMGRFGNPEELVGAVRWLSSDASSFVTGAIIPIDGGFSAFSGV